MQFPNRIHSFFHPSLVKGYLIAVTVLYPLVFIWQGGDLTDSGYHATNFHFFFKSLPLGDVNSLTFLTNFIGGLWLAIFPNLGIIGLKFLYLLFLYSSFYFSYKTLRPYSSSSNILLLFLMVGIVFSTRYTMFVFNYDMASWTFLVGSIYFFTRDKKSRLNKIMAGIFLGLAVLSRLSDISLLLFLPFVLFLAHFLKLQTINKSIKQLSFLFLGFSLLLISFFIALWATNLLSTYVQNLGFFSFSQEAKPESSYLIMDLLSSYLKELLQLVPHIVVVIVSYGILSYWSKRNTKVLILFFIVLFSLACYTYFGYSYTSNLSYLIPALCLPILYILIIKRDSLALLSLLVLAYTLAQVVGTNTGLLLKMSFGFTLLIPICFLYLQKHNKIFLKFITVKTKPILLFAFMLITSLGYTARMTWIYNVDYGFPCRKRAIYSINNPKMQNIYTVYYIADEIEYFTAIIKENKEEENTLFIFGHKPMFYYLTQSYPAIKEYWLGNNVYTAQVIFDKLEKSVSINNKWPLIVDTKEQVMGKEGEAALQRFLKTHQYRMVLQEEKINIWKKDTP